MGELSYLGLCDVCGVFKQLQRCGEGAICIECWFIITLTAIEEETE